MRPLAPMRLIILTFLLTLALPLRMAAATDLQVQKVTDGVYAIVGPKVQRSPENLGNNSTFGLVVTNEGAVLIDAGGSYKGAAALDAVIKSITKQPVKVVIDSGGQDHRWIGNKYWKEKGARIIASEAAVADQRERGSMQLTMLKALIKDKLAGTDPVYADTTFADSYKFTLGGTTFEIYHKGQAHTPGDSFVWLPQSKVMFTGDIVFVERILGVGPMSNAGSWIKVFDAMAAFKPQYIVPGHGSVTDLAHARADTRDYLANLRKKIAEHMEAGGSMIDSVKVDQSAFSKLENFKGLAKRNAQQVFSEMEFE